MGDSLKTKSLFISVVGRPNVGKSSLVNMMVGSKVSIVSPKPQTTRNKVLGILTQNNTQFVFIDTPVSPELLPPKDGEIAQITEDLVGPYELHDFFLYYILRFGYAPMKVYRIAKLAFEGVYDEAFILKWLKTFYWRFFAQQFKRSCVPDGPKVGTVAMSPRGDLRMPSDASINVWKEELDELE